MSFQIYDRDKDDPPIPWNVPPISGRIYWVRQMVNHIYEPIALLQVKKLYCPISIFVS